MKKTVGVITPDRFIDASSKKQMKNGTLHICRLLQLTWFFQYISNLPKSILAFTHPVSSIYIARVIIFQVFHGKQIFSCLDRFIYKLGKHFFVQSIIILVKLPTLNLSIKSRNLLRQFFVDEILVSNYHGCKKEAINLIPHYMIDMMYKTL